MKEETSLRIRVPDIDLDMIFRQNKVIIKGIELDAPHNLGEMAVWLYTLKALWSWLNCTRVSKHSFLFLWYTPV